MLIPADYWMGRDILHGAELDNTIRRNAMDLLGRVNLLLTWAKQDGVYPGTDATTGTPVASGWRPRAINASVRGGKLHPLGQAIDLRDTAPRALARWCLQNLDSLVETGLWMEDPQWTPSWVHLQSVPPASGRRVFIPNNNPPVIARLPEQEARA